MDFLKKIKAIKPQYEAWCRYDGYTPPHLEWYRVLKHTSCGVWLDMGYAIKPKFVMNTGRKRWAYKNKINAKESYRMRKIRQIEHLERQLENARTGLASINGAIPLKIPNLLDEDLY